jgi:hydroxyacylglutathione hydrolase
MTLEAWRAAGGTTTSTPLVGAEALLTSGVLHVRQDPEYASGHVPGAGHLELGSLPDRAGEVGEGPIVVMCGHGERAATAASVLEAAGRSGTAILDGGPGDWAAITGEELEA